MFTIEEKQQLRKESVTSFLKREIKGPIGTTLDIRHLYDNTYRLNFWGKRVIHINKGEDRGVIYSVWVVVKPTKKGFKIVEKDDK